MTLYDKWLRLWAAQPIVELVDYINAHPEVVKEWASRFYDVGGKLVYISDISNYTRVRSTWYSGASSKLLRRAVNRALVKQLVK